MNWHISRFHAGELVEVRSKEQILATLDEHGCVEQMPFMPEMLKFCGQRFRVSGVAHKTCETATGSCQGRRMSNAVHLDGVRCDGAAHGGCQAYCNIFWKDAWLMPVREGVAVDDAAAAAASAGYTESRLQADTLQPAAGEDGAPRYSCQVTMLNAASQPLPWWDVRQYAYDVSTRNYSTGHVLGVLWIASLTNFFKRTPIAWRLVKAFRETMHRWLMKREVPDVLGEIPFREPTPTLRLDLRPGERVRVRPLKEITKTINMNNQNRGMYFDREMSPYCGGDYTVHSSVTRIIDELTGVMRHMKQPCIILDGVFCKSEYSTCRLMCPRKIPPYWREIWLERVSDEQPSEGSPG